MRAGGIALPVREGLADVLIAYLGAAGRAPFRWGGLDCFLFVADWIERVTGIDPAGAYRGAYTTPREARALIRANGGALAFAERLLTQAGLMETSDAMTGDVGLVHAALAIGTERRTVMVPVGGICTGVRGWAVKTAGASLTVAPCPLIRAWALPVSRPVSAVNTRG